MVNLKTKLIKHYVSGNHGGSTDHSKISSRYTPITSTFGYKSKRGSVTKSLIF